MEFDENVFSKKVLESNEHNLVFVEIEAVINKLIYYPRITLS